MLIYGGMNMIRHVIDKIRNEMKSYKAVFAFTISAFLFALFCQYQKSAVVQRDNHTMLEMKFLHEMSSNVENQKAYLYIQDIPYHFSFLDEFNHGYYFVYDETNVYIAYMNEKDFKKLSRDDLFQSSTKIKGITRKSPKELK